MSEDKPRQRIDWNGEEDNQTATLALKRHWKRKAAVPATVGLIGLALVGALAAGPVMRSLASQEAAIDTIHTADTVPVAIATPETIESSVKRPKAEAAPVPAVQPKLAASARARVETAGLDARSPRWNPDALTIDESKLSALKAAVRETVAAAEIASAIGADDGLLTSNMPVQAAGFAPERPRAPASERSAFDAALVSADDGSEEIEASDASSLRPARATAHVNMRAAPSDDASVVAVVPANAAIEAEADCRWCEVSYDGQTGYIFQRFIAHN